MQPNAQYINTGASVPQEMSYGHYAQTSHTSTTYNEAIPQHQMPTQQAYQQQHFVTDQGYWIQGYKGYMHPLLVTLVNFFLPGLGHVLIKQTGKGISLFVGFYVTLVIVIAFCFIILGFFAIPFFVILWILIMVDGWQCASKLRQGFPLMKGECTNRVIGFYAKLIKDGPVFVTSKPETWPEEYRARVSQTSMSYP